MKTSDKRLVIPDFMIALKNIHDHRNQTVADLQKTSSPEKIVYEKRMDTHNQGEEETQTQCD